MKILEEAGPYTIQVRKSWYLRLADHAHMIIPSFLKLPLELQLLRLKMNSPLHCEKVALLPKTFHRNPLLPM